MLKSNHKYITNPRQLFEESIDDDGNDEDQYSFRPRFPLRRQSHSNNRENELQRRRQLLIDKQYEIEKRTLDSAKRCLGLAYDTEAVGINIGEELIRQGEILNKTNKTLDEMDPKLKESKKYINGINSVFYTVKNYVFKKNTSQSEKSSHNLHCACSNSMLTTSLNKFSERSEISRNHNDHSATVLRKFDQQEQLNPATRSKQVDDALEDNLVQMEQVINGLKGLGIAIHKEVHEQNELLDLMHDKVDDVDTRTRDQTKMVNKIHGK